MKFAKCKLHFINYQYFQDQLLYFLFTIALIVDYFLGASKETHDGTIKTYPVAFYSLKNVEPVIIIEFCLPCFLVLPIRQILQERDSPALRPFLLR